MEQEAQQRQGYLPTFRAVSSNGNSHSEDISAGRETVPVDLALLAQYRTTFLQRDLQDQLRALAHMTPDEQVRLCHTRNGMGERLDWLRTQSHDYANASE